MTPSNVGLLIVRSYLIGKFMVIRMCLTSAFCYKVLGFFVINDLLNQLLNESIFLSGTCQIYSMQIY